MNEKILKGIEYLFYLMILLYLVGKSYEVITILIDVMFIVYCFMNKDKLLEFYTKFKKVIFSFGLLIIYFVIQSLFKNDISI